MISFTAELYISSIVIGGTLCGGVPLFFEMGCETVYPIPESVIAGLMTMWNNISVIIFFVVFYIPNIGKFGVQCHACHVQLSHHMSR